MTDPRLASLSPAERALLFQRLQERKRSAAPPSAVLPLAPRDRSADPPPLSFAQQRLWFLDRLLPGQPIYNIASSLRVTGPLDVRRLRQALAGVAARHETLRTTFQLVGTEPVQIIAPAPPSGALPVIDLSSLDEGRREEEAERLRVEDILRPFDLAAGPLLRAALARLGPDRHLLLLTFHHIISDGWSTGVLIRDLTTLYDSHSGGALRALPELPLQYADFAVWQRRWLSGEVLERQLAVWRRRLEGAPASLDLPADRPRPAMRSGRGALVTLRLEPEVVGPLKELARAAGTTLFNVLLAAYQALLARWTGQEDLVVGAPVANRNRAEVAELIGFFVNTLVLRGDLSGDPGFRELVGRLRGVILEAFEHQDLPFEKLVEELRPQRDPSRPPLTQVMLVLQNTPEAALSAGGLQLEPFEAESRAAKVDVSLSLAENGGALEGALTYSTDLFDTPTMQRFAAHFEVLATAACAAPDRRLSDLPLLTEREQAQLLREWNDTAGPAGEALVPELFARCAALFPDRTAVVCSDGSLTYSELARQVESLARELRRRGVGPEVRVGLAAGRTLAMIEGLLAILTAGGAYVPLDPALPAGRWADLLSLAGVAFVLDSSSFSPLSRAGGVRVGEGGQGGEDLPESAAYVIFTSGSTGEPKGVVVEHRQLRNYVAAVGERLGLDQPMSCALVSTFAADLGHTVLFPALCSGGCLHVIPPETALDPEAFARYAREHAIDALKIVPSHLAGLLQAARPEEVLPRRLLVLGGEAASWELVERVAGLAPCRIANHYGPTEATVGALAQRIEPAVVSSQPRPRRPPLGRPLRNVEAYVLDPRQRPVPAGVPGELFLGGAGLARGYLGRPDLTAERFVPDPFAGSGGRLYRTGDRVRWLPDGTLEFLGRADRQVKIRGFRVEPGEVEAALARHPDVGACAVAVRTGADGEVLGLTAYVVPRHGEDLSPRDLRAWLAGVLPAALVPAGWAVLEALPLTANGKVDREALERLAPERPEAAETEAPPRTAVERELAAVWCEVLGAERVGIGDSFFDLGGHSLLLPRVQAAVRQRLGREVPLLKLFEHPTVEALAAWLEEGSEAVIDTGESRERGRRQRQGLELQRQRFAQRRTS
jgi:amino acid adenylation domain-containing protein